MVQSKVLLISLKARGRKEKERGRREVAMLKSLDSNFVIRLVDAFEGRSEVILVTEYLAGGELFERVVDEDFDLTESHCVLFVRQICQGVDRHNIKLSKTRCYCPSLQLSIIHPKSGCPGCPNSAENSNFPQKDCLRTRKLSVSVPES